MPKTWKKSARHRRRRRRIYFDAIRCPHRCSVGIHMGALRVGVERRCNGCGSAVETYRAWMMNHA